MAEAVYNASGPRPAHRDDDRQPRDRRADQHLERPLRCMSMRDAGWIQLFAETNQEALDLHIQAFRLAEELSCPVMVCVDGFILTHAYERVDVPEPGARSTPSCRPTSRVQVLDPADPVSIGAMVGPDAFMEVRYLAHHKQMRALDAHPAAGGRVQRGFGRDVRRARAALPHGGRRDDRRRAWARSSARSRTWSTRCAPMGISVGALVDPLVPPVPAGGGARGAARRARVVVLEKSLAVGLGGIVASRRAHGAVRASARTATRVDRRAWAGGRSPRRRSSRLIRRGGATSRSRRAPSSTSTHDVVERRAGAREPRRAAPDRSPRTCCARVSPAVAL